MVDDDQWVRDAAAGGVPTAVTEFMLGILRAARLGEFAVVDPTLNQMIGREPIPFSQTVRQALRG